MPRKKARYNRRTRKNKLNKENIQDNGELQMQNGNSGMENGVNGENYLFSLSLDALLFIMNMLDANSLNSLLVASRNFKEVINNNFCLWRKFVLTVDYGDRSLLPDRHIIRNTGRLFNQIHVIDIDLYHLSKLVSSFKHRIESATITKCRLNNPGVAILFKLFPNLVKLVFDGRYPGCYPVGEIFPDFDNLLFLEVFCLNVDVIEIFRKATELVYFVSNVITIDGIKRLWNMKKLRTLELLDLKRGVCRILEEGFERTPPQDQISLKLDSFSMSHLRDNQNGVPVECLLKFLSSQHGHLIVLELDFPSSSNLILKEIMTMPKLKFLALQFQQEEDIDESIFWSMNYTVLEVDLTDSQRQTRKWNVVKIHRFLECFLELEYVTLRIHMDLIFDEINPTVIPPNFSFNLNHLVKLKEVCIYECDVILFRLLNLKLLVALGFDDFPMVQSSPPLTHTDYKKLVKNCPNIRELICKIYSFEIFPQTIEILCKGLPLLHSLDIRVNANQWRLKGIPKCREFLRTILENCKNLQKLTIVRFAGAECDYEKILEEFAEKLGQMDLCLRYFSKRSKSLDRILYERN